MLRKLLKYELMAMSRVLVPLYLVMIAASALFAVNLNMRKTGGMEKILDKFAVFTGVLMVASVITVMVAMLIMIVQRFYKNLLGQEGYLMFTLPATTLEHIAAKLIGAFCWIVIGVGAGIASGLVMITIVGDLPKFLEQAGEVLPMLLRDGDLTSQLFSVVLLLAFSLLKSISQVYAAFAVGHQLGSHRLAGSILAYIGFGVIEMLFMLIPGVKTLMRNDQMWNGSFIGVSKYLAFLIALTLVYGGICWRLLDRKLNLE